ncbi:MAG: TIGR02300 family protein [Alphaproteobacteria bacterium]|nr:TIGR02300 family protein [Alphaproteobacteria bacterium]
MAKPEWGTKRECHGCGARFYDLRRDPVVCPGCAAVFVVKAPKPKPPVEKKAEVKDEKPKRTAAAGEGATDGSGGDIADVDVEDEEDEDEGDSFAAHASELEGGDDVDLGISAAIGSREGER